MLRRVLLSSPTLSLALLAGLVLPAGVHAKPAHKKVLIDFFGPVPAEHVQHHRVCTDDIELRRVQDPLSQNRGVVLDCRYERDLLQQPAVLSSGAPPRLLPQHLVEQPLDLVGERCHGGAGASAAAAGSGACMSPTNSVGSGLLAALLLARGRRDGMRYVRADLDGVQYSFWALAVSAPAIICLQLIAWAQDTIPANASHVLALDMMTYVVGWLGFVVLSFYIVPLFNAGPHWGRFVVVWNWCNVV